MTRPSESTSRTAPARVGRDSSSGETWARVDAGFYVGSRAGEYLGAIETVAGGFVAIDAAGTPVGRYATRSDARAALGTVVVDAEAIHSRRRRAALGRTAATVAGAISVGGTLSAAAVAAWL